MEHHKFLTSEEKHTARWAEFSHAFEAWLRDCKPTATRANEVMTEAGKHPDNPMIALELELESLNNND